MSRREIDDYLAAVDEPKQTTLKRLRQTILDKPLPKSLVKELIVADRS